MTLNSMRPTLRGRLARHLGRLQQSLDEVAEQVREVIATKVGRRVAEAVGEAVYEALCPGSGPAQSLSHSSYAGYDSASRRDWNEPVWQRKAARYGDGRRRRGNRQSAQCPFARHARRYFRTGLTTTSAEYGSGGDPSSS